MVGQRNVVVARQPDLLRHQDATLGERTDEGNRRHVTGGKDRVEGQVQVQPLVNDCTDARVAKRKGLQQPRVLLEPRLVQRTLVALEALAGFRVRAVSKKAIRRLPWSIKWRVAK